MATETNCIVPQNMDRRDRDVYWILTRVSVANVLLRQNVLAFSRSVVVMILHSENATQEEHMQKLKEKHF